MEIPKLIKFKKIDESEKGCLTVAQYSENIPFSIKRVFWIHGMISKTTRGNHAHRRLQSVVICLKGSVKVWLEDPFNHTFFFELSDSQTGLFIPSLYWEKFEFSLDSILLVLCSELYEQNDYIWKRQDFIKTGLQIPD